MKNRLIAFFIAALFLVASSAFTLEKGGTVITIWDKNVNTQYVFSLPEKYIDKQGKLVLPIEIELDLNGKRRISLTSNHLMVILPSMNYSGACSITVQIGDYCARRLLN